MSEIQEETLAPHARPEIPYRRISALEHFKLAAYWFGSNFVWGALLGIANPH